MKKLIFILFSLISLAGFSQVSSPDSLSIGGTTYIDSIFIRNDSLIFRATGENEYGVEKYTSGGGEAHSGQVYYVANDGNDVTGNGSEDYPWQTPAHAETQATSPGDTIALKKGDIFLIDELLEITHGGDADDDIVWDGALWGTGDDAMIRANTDGGASPIYNCFVRIAACDYVTMENITFDGNHTTRSGLVIGGADAVFGSVPQNDERFITIQDCAVRRIASAYSGGNVYYGILASAWDDDQYNITIQRNTVDSVSNPGINLYNGRTDLGASQTTFHNSLIANNTLTNCGLAGGVGYNIILKGDFDSCIVESNTITQGANGTVAGLGFEIDTSLDMTKIHVRYNDVRMTDTRAFLLIGQHGTTTGLVDIDAYYNIFASDTSGSTGNVRVHYTAYEAGSKMNFWNNAILFGDGQAGISLANTTADMVTIQNNAIVGQGYLISYASVAVDPTHDHNSYYNSTAGNYILDDGVPVSLANMGSWEATATVTDPSFHTDFTNLHPQTGSPMLDAGVDVGLTQDFEGTAVPDPPNTGIFEDIEDP